MKILAFFLIVLLVLQVSSQLSGGYTNVDLQSPTSTTQLANATAFAVKTYPFLANATLIAAQTQVVAGTNFRLTYRDNKGSQYQIVVFEQPWTQTIRVVEAKRVS